jgi:hypothetical protein
MFVSIAGDRTKTTAHSWHFCIPEYSQVKHR